MILIALLSAVGFVIILLKGIGVKKIIQYEIQYEIQLDVLFTVGFFMLSNGTYTGIAMAVIAGVTFSLILLIIRLIFK